MGNLFQNRDNLRCGRVFCLSAAAALVLAALPSSAYAFTSFHAQIEQFDAAPEQVADDVGKPIVTNSPSSSVLDPCLPLLKSIHASPSISTERNQRSAGKSADLGLVFGVRFALSPTLKANSTPPKARFGFWQHHPSSAGSSLARTVNAYESCLTDQAISALREFRWKR